MSIFSELHPITYFALALLGVVLYLRYKQSIELKRQAREQLQPNNPYLLGTPQGPTPEPQVYGSFGSNLPTFSAQEVEQRKPAKDITSLSMNPRNLQNNPEFGSNNIPPFHNIYLPKERPIESSDKMFESAKRNTSYEATKRLPEPSPAFGTQSRSSQDTKYTPIFQPILDADVAMTSEIPKNPIVPINAPLNLSGPNPQPTSVINTTIQITKEEIHPAGSSTMEQTAHKISLEEEEYNVFKETFKQREGGSSFREEAKKFESPMRLDKETAGLMRVGHSPDSPFRIFASPNIGSKNKEDLIPKAQKQRPQSLLSKKDSFSRTQEALEQAPKSKGSVQTASSKSTKLSAVQKGERKARAGQIFIENNSDDEMAVEEEIQAANKNKRAGNSSFSIDNLEKESSKKKFRNNFMQAKEKPQFVKKASKEIGDKSLDSAKQSQKKESTVAISYLSAYGSNASMRKYVAKKAATDDNTRATKSLNTTFQPKSSAMEIISSQSFTRTQDKPKVEPPKSFSLIQPSGPAAVPKKPVTNGSFLMTNQPKSMTQEPISSPKPVASPKPVSSPKPFSLDKTSTAMVAEEKLVLPPATGGLPTGGLLFGGLTSQQEKKPEEKKIVEEKPVETKTEAPKMSAMLGGSSLFSQKAPETSSSLLTQKPAETGPSLFSQKPTETGSSLLTQKAPETGPSLFSQKPAETGPSLFSQKPAETGSSLLTQKPVETSSTLFSQKPAETGSSLLTQKAPETGLSLFSQKPAETSSNTFSSLLKPTTPLIQPAEQDKKVVAPAKPESPKKEASEKEAAPKSLFTQQPATGGSDIFKTIRPGGNAPLKLDESKDKPETQSRSFGFLQKEDKKEEAVKKDQPQSSGPLLNLFGNGGEKKVKETISDDTEKEKKPEAKGGLFSSNEFTSFSGTGGLFGNLGGAKPATTVTEPKKEEPKKDGFSLTQTQPKTESAPTSFLSQTKPLVLGGLGTEQSSLFSPKKSDREELKSVPLQKPPSFSELTKSNSSPPKDDKNQKGGLFGQKPLFGAATEEKKGPTQSGLGLFSGTAGSSMFKPKETTEQNDGAAKKIETPAFGSTKPAGDTENKPGLFGNGASGFGSSSQNNALGGGSFTLGSGGALFGANAGSGTTGGSLFGGTALSGGLSGGLFGNKENKTTGGGLFANLNNNAADSKK